jgi:hypothetical protein
VTDARKHHRDTIPSKDIETLVEMATKVVAANFDLYPDLEGVDDENVQKEVPFNLLPGGERRGYGASSNCDGADGGL